MESGGRFASVRVVRHHHGHVGTMVAPVFLHGALIRAFTRVLYHDQQGA